MERNLAVEYRTRKQREDQMREIIQETTKRQGCTCLGMPGAEGDCKIHNG